MEPDVPRRAGLLLGLGTAQSRAGRPAARATFEAAVAAARQIEADDIFAARRAGVRAVRADAGLRRRGARRAARRGAGADRPRRRPDARAAARLARRRAVLVRQRRAPHGACARGAGDGAPPGRRHRRSRSRSAPRSWRRTDPTRPSRACEWLRELFALTERAGETVMSLAARSRHVDVLHGARRPRGRRHRDRGARAAGARRPRSPRRRVRAAAPRPPRRARRALRGRRAAARRGRGGRRRAVGLDDPDHGRRRSASC